MTQQYYLGHREHCTSTQRCNCSVDDGNGPNGCYTGTSFLFPIGRGIVTETKRLQLSAVLTAVRARLESSQKYSDAKLDILAAAGDPPPPHQHLNGTLSNAMVFTGLALSMLEGAPTTNRLLILRLCCHVLFQQVGSL